MGTIIVRDEELDKLTKFTYTLCHLGLASYTGVTHDIQFISTLDGAQYPIPTGAHTVTLR